MGKALQIQGDTVARSFLNGITYYWPATSASIKAFSQTETDVQRTFRRAGVLSGLYLRVLTNDCSISTARCRVNGVDGAQVVSIAASTTGEFEDLSNSDDIGVGDEVNYSIVVGATGTALTMKVTAGVFEAATDTVSTMMFGDGFGLGTESVTRYIIYCGSATTAQSAETSAHVNVGAAGTVHSLFVYVAANARTSTTTYISRVNLGNGNMTLSVGAGLTGVFEDTVNSDAVAVGALVNAAVITGVGTGTITTQLCGVEFTTTTGHSLLAGGRQNGMTFAAGTTYHIPASGEAGPTAGGDGTDISVEVQYATVGSFIWCYISNNTVQSASTFTIYRNQIPTIVSASIPALTTGEFTDAVNTVSFSASTDELGLGVVVGAGGTSFIMREYGMVLLDDAGAGVLTSNNHHLLLLRV